ncbi:MAG: transposase [Candidatus Latescibacteria bacterium]|nr:transposase [Candidatus Latescibacterota bacterium]
MIEIDTRLRVARGIAKTETQASIEVFQTLQKRGHPDAPPATGSDGWGGIDDAMVYVYGQVPPYSGRGRPPTRKVAQPGWQYLQMVKQRDAHSRVTGIKPRVIFGHEQTVLDLLGAHTAYSERTHLTMRHFNSRLTRKSLAFSKALPMYRASAAWEDLYYNFARPLKTLPVPTWETPPKQWEPCTPAMAAGLTLRIWTPKQLLTAVVPPKPTNT